MTDLIPIKTSELWSQAQIDHDVGRLAKYDNETLHRVFRENNERWIKCDDRYPASNTPQWRAMIANEMIRRGLIK